MVRHDSVRNLCYTILVGLIAVGMVPAYAMILAESVQLF
jgi:Flp pilus assembly pilin Flp